MPVERDTGGETEPAVTETASDSLVELSLETKQLLGQTGCLLLTLAEKGRIPHGPFDWLPIARAYNVPSREAAVAKLAEVADRIWEITGGRAASSDHDAAAEADAASVEDR